MKKKKKKYMMVVVKPAYYKLSLPIFEPIFQPLQGQRIILYK